MPEANYRITHANGSYVDVYINPSQLQQAMNGKENYQASICIIFREERKKQFGVASFVSWDNLTVGNIPPTRSPFVSRREAMEEEGGECCGVDSCTACNGDQRNNHGSCRYGCTLDGVA